MPILSVENLRKVYGKDYSEVVALDGVSFSVERGEFIAVVGTSGSGKSTLMHCIGGVDTPTSGRILLDSAVGAVFALYTAWKLKKQTLPQL